MTFAIVPNSLSNAIHAAINTALGDRECDDETRERLYQQLLEYYDEHGTIPSFSITAKECL